MDYTGKWLNEKWNTIHTDYEMYESLHEKRQTSMFFLNISFVCI